MGNLSARFYLPENEKIMEEVYFLQTLKLFSERFGKSEEEIVERYTMMEEGAKEEIKNLKARIETARKRRQETLANWLTEKLNKLTSKASEICPKNAVIDSLLPWIEQSSFKSIYEKLGFITEVPPIKGYEKTWKISTIHPYSYGLTLPDESTKVGKISKKIGLTSFVEKRGINPSHFLDVEDILIMEKNNVYYAREGSIHGYYSHFDKKLGEYNSLEEILNDWTFKFYPGDHSVRVLKNEKIKNKITKFLKNNNYKKLINLVPIGKRKNIRQMLRDYTETNLETTASEVFNAVTPKFEIMGYENVKEFFGFKPYYDFISNVFELDDLMKQNLTNKEYNKYKELIWGTSLEDFKDIKKDLILISDKQGINEEVKEKIKKTTNELYLSRAELKTNLFDYLDNYLEKPEGINKIFSDNFKDLPITAKLSLVYSIKQLVRRPLWDIYREKTSFKRNFVYSFLGAYVWVKGFYKLVRGRNKYFKYYKSLNPLYNYYKLFKKAHNSLLFSGLLGLYMLGKPIQKITGYDKKCFKYYNTFYKRTEHLNINEYLKKRYDNCIKYYKPVELLHDTRYYQFFKKLFKKTLS